MNQFYDPWPLETFQMKTYIAIAVLGCCSFAAITYAQKPGNGDSRFVDLLPVGTNVLKHEESGNCSLEVVLKNATPEELNSSFIKQLDARIAELWRQGPINELTNARIGELEFAKTLLSSHASSVFAVTGVGT